MFPASRIFAPFAPIPLITPTHSRLRRLARTSGGSVSGLLPTRRRRRTRHRAPPGPAALSPGSDRHGGGPDRWRLRRRARTGGGSVSGLLPTLHRRRLRRRAPPGPAALSPGSDRHGARLRAPTDPAPPSPPSPGPSRPGGAVTGLGSARRGPRPVAAPSPGSYPGRQCPPPSYMSVLHRRPWAK